MKKIFRNYLSIFFTFVILLSSITTTSYGLEMERNVLEKSSSYSSSLSDVQSILDDLSKSLEFKDSSSSWHIFDMAAYGKKEDLSKKKEYFESALSVINNEKAFSTDYERTAIVLSSLGYDTSKIKDSSGNEIDLIEKIYNYNKNAEKPSLGSVNGYIFALLAYDSGGYIVPNDAYWNRNKVVDYLVETAQHDDGGWSLSIDKSTNSDPDMTAMAISALTPYRKDPRIKNSLDKAVDFLSERYKKDKGFKSWGSINSNSSSMVILALSGLGIDSGTDSRFTIDNMTVIDNLMSFKTTDGRFGYTDKNHNAFATEQAFRGLVAYEKFKRTGIASNIYNFGDLEEKKKVSFEIRGLDSTGSIFKDNNIIIEKNMSAFDLLEKISNDKKIELKYSNTAFGVYIEGIAGLNSGENGFPRSGWMYKINGESPNVGSDLYKLSGGDNVYFYFVKDYMDNPDKDFKEKVRESIVDLSKKYYSEKDTPIEANIGLINSDKDISKDKKEEILNTTKNLIKDSSSVEQLSNSIILLESLGQNSLNIDGENIVSKLYNKDLNNASIIDYADVLLAISNSKYTPINAKNTTKNLIDYLLKHQNNNGGFGDKDSIVTTSRVLTSLSPYRESIEVNNAINKGLEYLEKNQNVNGTVEDDNKRISDAISEVIISLTANNISPEDARFRVDGKNLIERLLSYKTSTGEFSSDSSEESDKVSTKKAFIALISYEKYKNDDGHLYYAEKNYFRKKYKSFLDEVNISDWAKKEIEKAKEIDMISGDDLGYVNPKNNVSRVEFVKILLLAKEEQVEEDGNTSFEDVDSSSWYAPFVKKANEIGLVYGTGEKTFSPNKEITREEMATMLYRIYKLKGSIPKVEDVSEISEYALEPIGGVIKSGILQGVGENKFQPKGKASREMSIVAVIRALEKLEYKVN